MHSAIIGYSFSLLSLIISGICLGIGVSMKKNVKWYEVVVLSPDKKLVFGTDDKDKATLFASAIKTAQDLNTFSET